MAQTILNCRERVQLSEGGYAHAHQLLAGVYYMFETFDKGKSKGSKIPSNDMKHVYISFFIPGWGKYDLKKACTEMTA